MKPKALNLYPVVHLPPPGRGWSARRRQVGETHRTAAAPLAPVRGIERPESFAYNCGCVALFLLFCVAFVSLWAAVKVCRGVVLVWTMGVTLIKVVLFGPLAFRTKEEER